MNLQCSLIHLDWANTHRFEMNWKVLFKIVWWILQVQIEFDVLIILVGHQHVIVNNLIAWIIYASLKECSYL